MKNIYLQKGRIKMNKTKRLMSIVLSVALLITTLAVAGLVASADAGVEWKTVYDSDTDFENLTLSHKSNGWFKAENIAATAGLQSEVNTEKTSKLYFSDSSAEVGTAEFAIEKGTLQNATKLRAFVSGTGYENGLRIRCVRDKR